MDRWMDMNFASPAAMFTLSTTSIAYYHFYNTHSRAILHRRMRPFHTSFPCAHWRRAFASVYVCYGTFDLFCSSLIVVAFGAKERTLEPKLHWSPRSHWHASLSNFEDFLYAVRCAFFESFVYHTENRRLTVSQYVQHARYRIANISIVDSDIHIYMNVIIYTCIYDGFIPFNSPHPHFEGNLIYIESGSILLLFILFI